MDLDKFRNILNELKTQAIESMSKRAPEECMRGDSGDNTQNLLNHRLTTGLMERNAANVRRIEAALKRIKAGSFGYCTECEEPIEEQRLESRPITTLCISCKEDEERLQSNFAGSRKRTA